MYNMFTNKSKSCFPAFIGGTLWTIFLLMLNNKRKAITNPACAWATLPQGFMFFI